MAAEDQDMYDMVDDDEDYQIKTKKYKPIVHKNSMHYPKVHNSWYPYDGHEISNDSTILSEASLPVKVTLGLF